MLLFSFSYVLLQKSKLIFNMASNIKIIHMSQKSVSFLLWAPLCSQRSVFVRNLIALVWGLLSNHTYSHIHSHTKALPSAEKVQSSSQSNNQQNHEENDDNYLLFTFWPQNKFQFLTPGTNEACLTPATQTDESCITTHDDKVAQIHLPTHIATCDCPLPWPAAFSVCPCVCAGSW